MDEGRVGVEPRVIFTTYYLDECTDSVLIDFTGKTVGSYGTFELPDHLKTIVYYKESDTGVYQYIEVVDPEIFVNSPELEDFEVNGFNVRNLILDAYENESKYSN